MLAVQVVVTVASRTIVEVVNPSGTATSIALAASVASSSTTFEDSTSSSSAFTVALGDLTSSFAFVGWVTSFVVTTAEASNPFDPSSFNPCPSQEFVVVV